MYGGCGPAVTESHRPCRFAGPRRWTAPPTPAGLTSPRRCRREASCPTAARARAVQQYDRAVGRFGLPRAWLLKPGIIPHAAEQRSKRRWRSLQQWWHAQAEDCTNSSFGRDGIIMDTSFTVRNSFRNSFRTCSLVALSIAASSAWKCKASDLRASCLRRKTANSGHAPILALICSEHVHQANVSYSCWG